MKNLLKVSSFLAIIAGIAMLGLGVWGIAFTYKNVSQENIITTSDASIPETKVLGPFTLKSQAEIIRKHALENSGGQTYSELPRFIPTTDELGNFIYNEAGEPVMVPNPDREMWITAVSLITALNLAIVTYAFSALILLLGAISIWTGIIFFFLSKKVRNN